MREVVFRSLNDNREHFADFDTWTFAMSQVKTQKNPVKMHCALWNFHTCEAYVMLSTTSLIRITCTLICTILVFAFLIYVYFSFCVYFVTRFISSSRQYKTEKLCPEYLSKFDLSPRHKMVEIPDHHCEVNKPCGRRKSTILAPCHDCVRQWNYSTEKTKLRQMRAGKLAPKLLYFPPQILVQCCKHECLRGPDRPPK